MAPLLPIRNPHTGHRHLVPKTALVFQILHSPAGTYTEIWMRLRA